MHEVVGLQIQFKPCFPPSEVPVNFAKIRPKKRTKVAYFTVIDLINNAFTFDDRAEKPVEIDHHLCEFGSVEYHIQVKLQSLSPF